MSANFYQFYKVLIAVTEGSLHDVEDIKNSVTNELKVGNLEAFIVYLNFYKDVTRQAMYVCVLGVCL